MSFEPYRGVVLSLGIRMLNGRILPVLVALLVLLAAGCSSRKEARAAELRLQIDKVTAELHRARKKRSLHGKLKAKKAVCNKAVAKLRAELDRAVDSLRRGKPMNLHLPPPPPGDSTHSRVVLRMYNEAQGLLGDGRAASAAASRLVAESRHWNAGASSAWREKVGKSQTRTTLNKAYRQFWALSAQIWGRQYLERLNPVQKRAREKRLGTDRIGSACSSPYNELKSLENEMSWEVTGIEKTVLFAIDRDCAALETALAALRKELAATGVDVPEPAPPSPSAPTPAVSTTPDKKIQIRVGDGEGRVADVLGPPAGKMIAGGITTYMYDWGGVDVEAGKVVAVWER